MIFVKCEMCSGSGKVPCTACAAFKSVPSGREGQGGQENSAASDKAAGGQETDAVCEVCSGSGLQVCPGCCGSGYVDMPAFA